MSGFIAIAEPADAGGAGGAAVSTAAAARRGHRSLAQRRIAAVLIALGAAVLYPSWSNFEWHEPSPQPIRPTPWWAGWRGAWRSNPMICRAGCCWDVPTPVLEQFPLAARAYQRADTLAEWHRTREARDGPRRSAGEQRTQRSVRARRALVRAGAGTGSAIPSRRCSTAHSRPASATNCRWPGSASQRLLEGQSAAGGAKRHRGAHPGAGWTDADGRGGPQARVGGHRTGAATPQPSPRAAAPPVSRAAARHVYRSRCGEGRGRCAAVRAGAYSGSARAPPLAAKRLEATFPQDVDLLSTDAMLAGTGVPAGQEIEIEARVANGGSAISRSGDPFGTRARQGRRQHEQRAAALEINQRNLRAGAAR